MSRLDLVVGPNGAGKSTYVRLVLAGAAPMSAIVNADDISKQNWPEDAEAHSYDAAEIAAATRERLIDLRQPLIAETVFSHASKLELIHRAQAADYFVALHVLLVPIDLAVARVAARVAAGGHSVPTEKVRARYERLWLLVAAAINMADTSSVWDNSHIDGPRPVALFSRGEPVGSPSWPSWTPPDLAARWS
ncbi:MAG: hypothetical protein QG671_4538 [Actinomycetota bacterium]|nr:hypothetical protein [Actinomycetota bacterium]HQZ87091.1 zeta toxin family protein [Actinomycetota bacterium]